MNTLTINHGNGKSTTYQLMQAEKSMPIAYHIDTNQKVIKALESARQSRQRIKIYLGDPLTGKCWNEEHDTVGYIGLSKGDDAYYPILVYNERSYGGGAILDHCIVKIKESKGNVVLYQSSNFKHSSFDIKPVQQSDSNYANFTHALYIDGQLYSRHTSLKSAEILKKKLS